MSIQLIVCPGFAKFASTSLGLNTIITSATVIAVGLLSIWENRSDRNDKFNLLGGEVRALDGKAQALGGEVRCYAPHQAQPRAITQHSHSEWRSISASHRLRHTKSRMNHRGCLCGGCRLRSNPMDGTTCLAEDDHYLQNPRPVSPRTITNYRTPGDRCDMCRRRRLLVKEVEDHMPNSGNP